MKCKKFIRFSHCCSHYFIELPDSSKYSVQLPPNEKIIIPYNGIGDISMKDVKKIDLLCGKIFFNNDTSEPFELLTEEEKISIYHLGRTFESWLDK